MRWVWFAVWFLVGIGYCVGLLGAASIGLFVLPLPVLATVLLARARTAGVGLPGLVSGLGVPVLYVAYLNRSGPGTICTTTTEGTGHQAPVPLLGDQQLPDGQRCVDEGSPWPWLTVAAVLLVLGVAAFLAWQRHLAVQPSKGAPRGRDQGPRWPSRT